MNANGMKIDPGRLLGLAVTVGSVLFWAMTLYYASPHPFLREQYAILFVGGLLGVYTLDESRRSLSAGNRIETVALSASTLVLAAVTPFLFLNSNRIYIEWSVTTTDYAIAALLVSVVLYLAWREFGLVIPALVVGVIIYAMLGRTIPGPFGHDGVGIVGVLDVLVTRHGAFYGFGIGQAASDLAPFVLYTALLFGYGAPRLLPYAAAKAEAYIDSGFAQTSLLISAVVGSINGSYLANARLMGRFTVPTMEDRGVRDRTAAGIETAASTAGQALPPVMGLGMFAVAPLLVEISYIDVIVAGVVPAVILVCCLLVAVHFAVTSVGFEPKKQPSESLDWALTTADVLAQVIRFGAPILVLGYVLLIEQGTLREATFLMVVSILGLGIGLPVLRHTYEAFVDGSWLDESANRGDITVPRSLTAAPDAVQRASLVAVQIVSSASRFRPVRALTEALEETVWGLRRGVLVFAPVVIVLVVLSGAIELLVTTVTLRAIIDPLADIGDGGRIVAIVFALALSVIFTVGFPTLAAVGIVGIIVGPLLITPFGMDRVAAMFAVFYAAIAAGVVPRRATAAAETGRIAGVATWRVSRVAAQLVAPLFILPFAFVYHPELVSVTPDVATLRAGVVTLVGGIAVAYALNYPFRLELRLQWPLRAGLFVVGVVAMAHPTVLVQVAAGATFVLIVAVESQRR